MAISEKPSGSTGLKTPSRSWSEVLAIVIGAAFVTFLVWLFFGPSFDSAQGWISRVVFFVLGAGMIYLSFLSKARDDSLREDPITYLACCSLKLLSK